jgi:hypothetical protein
MAVGQFDAVHYAGVALFKIGIWLLNLFPMSLCASLHE